MVAVLVGLELELALRAEVRMFVADGRRPDPDVGLLAELAYATPAERARVPEELGPDGALVRCALIAVERLDMVMVAEYLFIKSTDRTRIYRLENHRLRDRRRADLDIVAAHELEPPEVGHERGPQRELRPAAHDSAIAPTRRSPGLVSLRTASFIIVPHFMAARCRAVQPGAASPRSCVSNYDNVRCLTPPLALATSRS